MSRLSTVLWELYLKGDSRISVIDYFQQDSLTYVKVIVNDGSHDVMVQEITGYPFTFLGHEKEALNDAIKKALEKVANIITEKAIAPVIKLFDETL